MGDKASYYWYKSHGICVGCKTEYAEAGKTLCFDCLEKARIKQAEYRKKNVDKIRKQARERDKKLKELGLCRCGRPVEKGKVLCRECANKNNRRKCEKQHKEGKFYAEGIRAELGICRRCQEKVVDGYSYCQKHLEEQRKIMLNAKKQQPIEVRKRVRAEITLAFRG